MEALRGAGKLTAKPGKAPDVLQIGGWWHRDAGGRPTGSWAPPVVDERYIVGFLWSVLSRKWGRKLGKQAVMNQVLAFGGCFGAGRSAPGLFAADGGLTSSCPTRSSLGWLLRMGDWCFILRSCHGSCVYSVFQ